MKFSTITIIILCSNLYAGNLLANPHNNFYGGMQLAAGSYSVDNSPDDSMLAFVARAGSYLNDYFSVEGRIGFSLPGDSLSKLDSLSGVYSLAHIPISNGTSIYGLLGYSKAKAVALKSGYPVAGEGTGASYGAGLDIDFGKKVDMDIEYTKYLNKPDFNLSSVNMGVVIRF